MAGAYIALGTLVAIMVGGGSPGVALADPGLQKWLYAFMFPFGLVLIIIVGGELVTSNMSIMTLGVAAQRVSLWRLARNWLVVYLGNFAGSLFVAALLIQCTDLAEASPWHSFLVNGALKKVHLTWTQSVLRGVGCNWLVCLAVWSAQAAEDITGKILAIWFPITAFVAIGFEHCVAQMAFIPAAMMLGADISVGQMLGSAVIPVTIGNIIGALLVALPMYYVYWLPNPPVDIARCDFGLDHCCRRQHPARSRNRRRHRRQAAWPGGRPVAVSAVAVSERHVAGDERGTRQQRHPWRAVTVFRRVCCQGPCHAGPCGRQRRACGARCLLCVRLHAICRLCGDGDHRGARRASQAVSAAPALAARRP
jgi:formate/nitrite transporter